jgi:hypothetical protein
MDSKLIVAVKAIEGYVKGLVGDSAEVFRHYVPLVDLEELNALGKPKIIVLPYSLKVVSATIAAFQFKLDIDLNISRKLQYKSHEVSEQIAEIDECIRINEKLIEQFIMVARIDGESGLKIVCKEPEQIVFNDFKMNIDDNCFYSVIRIKTEFSCVNPARAT